MTLRLGHSASVHGPEDLWLRCHDLFRHRLGVCGCFVGVEAWFKMNAERESLVDCFVVSVGGQISHRIEISETKVATLVLDGSLARLGQKSNEFTHGCAIPYVFVSDSPSIMC